MEQSRLLIAIALSFLVFFAWQALFVDKEAPQQQKTTAPSDQSAPATPAAPAVEPIITPAVPAAKPAELTPRSQAKTITVQSPFYAVEISEKGAAFKSFVLKNYRKRVEEDSPYMNLVPAGLESGTILTGFAGKSLGGIDHAIFAAQTPAEMIDATSSPQSVSFVYVTDEGITVEKTYLFSPETYRIGLTVTIQNASPRTITDSLTLSLMTLLPEKEERYGFSGPSALINNKLENIAIKKIKDKNTYTGKLKWVAVQDRYFMESIIPQITDVEAGMHLIQKENNLLETQYRQPVSVIPSGTQQRFEYQLFLGPKSMRILRQFGFDLDKAVNFGWFDFIAKPCLWLMNQLYRLIPNYGVDIIILTLFIKILLWPLGTKSYKSMNEMKKLQPLMTELREKYKHDKKKMNEEVMALYRVYKINPMGGCLPMVAQIPVFFALYRMLYEAIELRHAPFVGWINDLSAPDRLFSFSFSIPFMEPPYGIPVLTIVMGASMLLQQKMTPTPGDPMQAKMMMFMPVIFTFIFINFSSGLVLYWLINNILSMAQQYYITKKTA
ncbi:MAG: membrane protein insertase YidC [Desulfobacterales bacterium]|nr:membrane protein insertase YidC [Desulfobacterales bacterium]